MSVPANDASVFIEDEVEEEKRRVEGIQLFISSRTRENIDETEDNYTALMVASAQGELGFVKKFLKLGANPNLYDELGLNAAWWAACRRKWSVFKFLLPLTSRLDVKPASGEFKGATILWFAGRDQRWEIVEELINKYKVRDLDATLMTPAGPLSRILEKTIELEVFPITQLLVLKGANTNLQVETTPLMRSLPRLKYFKYLMIHGKAAIDAPISTDFAIEYEEYEVKTIRFAAIELFRSIREGLLTSNKLLYFLKLGAHLNQRSIDSNHTPLHMTIALDKFPAFKLILQELQSHSHAAQIYQLCATNQLNHTPLDTALAFEQDPNAEKTKALVFGNNEKDQIPRGVLEEAALLPANVKSIIYGYTPNPLNLTAALILNVIQNLINRKVMILLTNLAWLKLDKVSDDLAKKIQETLDDNCFATTPLAKAYVRQAYHRAFHCSRIQAIAKKTAQTASTVQASQVKKQLRNCKKNAEESALTDKENQKPSHTKVISGAAVAACAKTTAPGTAASVLFSSALKSVVKPLGNLNRNFTTVNADANPSNGNSKRRSSFTA